MQDGICFALLDLQKKIGRWVMLVRKALLGMVVLVLFGSASFAFQRCVWNNNYVEVSGEISGVSPPVAFVVSEGNRYVMRLGPYWFWNKQGYKLSKGEKVKIVGWRCGKMLFPKEIVKADGSVLRFRDKRGMPLWRRGRGWTQRAR